MPPIYSTCVVLITTLSAVVLVMGTATDVGNLRNLRGGSGSSIRRQRRVLDPFDPLTDSFSRALHYQHPEPFPLLLPTSHRHIQETTPTTNDDDDEARTTFVEQCTSFLLSSDIIHDGIISQIDFVDMLLHQCQLDNLCNDGLRLNFGQLDINLRVKFIRGICVRSNDDYPERFECIYKLYEMMRDESIFGFNATVDGVDSLVKEMCYATYLDAVHFGFVKSRAPTSSPITGLTNSPSFEVTSVPSIPPSRMDMTTPSSSPSIRDTFRPTSTPSIESTSSFPSESPSTFTVIDNDDVDPSASDDGDDSISTGGIAGITSATLFVTAAFVAVMYRYRPLPSPDMKSLKDEHHFGASSAHESWGKSGSSLPIPYMGLNCSVCSSSSSYRDCRFVNVFGPHGTPIPQFNPNTAGAVVIGSVTIRASSSYSSGQFGNSGSSQVRSAKSPSLFMRRKRSHHRHDAPKSDSGFSSRDDLSSISSRRSSFHQSNKYRNRRKMKSIRLDSRDVDTNAQVPLGSLQSSRTNVSVPLSHRQRQQMERQMKSDSQVLFGDWKATLDLSECRSPSDTADAAAILTHRKIVFNTLCPELTQLSNEHIAPPSSGCHSLPNMHFVPRAGSSDAGSSSILSESYFQDSSSLRQQKSVASSTKSASTNPFVPWRSEGFISSRVSDSRQSNESDAPSSSKSNVPEMNRRFNLVRRPGKAVIAKYKGSVKDWFSFRNSRQYHYLHKQDGVSALQEDPEVLSMISYSSNTHLLPPREEERDELPNLVLGTFAAASTPIGQKVILSKLFIGTSSAAAGVDAGVSESAGKALNCTDVVDESSTTATATRISPVEHHGDQPTIRTRVIRSHISSLDANVLHESTDSSSISAYSRSDFESSTPSKDSSYSSPATQSTSFAAVKEDADDSILTSTNLICVDDVGDADTTFAESKQASLLPGISRVVAVGKNPSLICDGDGSAAHEFNVVTRSGSESGNFLFPSDEEDDNAVADRKRIVVDDVTSTAGQNLGPNLVTPIEPSTFFAEEL